MKRVVEIAHAHNLPVIVDGAAQSFLIREIVLTGADLVICSGHKYLSGTTAGIVCGNADLIRAVALQNRGIGRPMKVGKEGIVGVMASLENRIKTDVDAWEAEQNRKMNLVIDRLQDIPGVHLGVDPDPNGNPFSRAKVSIEPDEAGISSAVVCAAMAGGDPSISLRCHHTDEGYFHVDTIEMSDEDVTLTCDRLEGILNSSKAEKAQLAEGCARAESGDHRKVWLS